MATHDFTVEQITADFGDARFALHRVLRHEPLPKSGDFSVLHSHIFYELHIAQSGFYTFMTESGAQTTLAHGQWMLIPPNYKHFSYVPGQNDFKDTVLAFSVQKTEANPHLFAAFVARAAALCFQPMALSDETRTMADTFSQLSGNALRDVLTQKLLATNLIYALLDGMHLMDAPSEIPESDTSDTARSLLLETMMNNDRLSLAEIAAQMNFSERHTARMIKEQYGVTFTEYRRKRRLSIAKKILETAPEVSVGAVCMMSGLKSETLFYRLFKAEYGITPGEYKRQLLESKDS